MRWGTSQTKQYIRSLTCTCMAEQHLGFATNAGRGGALGQVLMCNQHRTSQLLFEHVNLESGVELQGSTAQKQYQCIVDGLHGYRAWA